jgi:hypothetical protein
VSLGVTAAASAGLGLIMVIIAGFALSFDAIRTVGQASRIRHDWAWLLPAAVDGAMSVATVSVVVLRRLGRSTAYPWLVVGVNAAISLACNGLHAQMGEAVHLPSAITMAVSAVPALNLALSVHLLVVLVEGLAMVNPGPADDRVIQEQEDGTESNNPHQELPTFHGTANGRELQRQAWQWAQAHPRPDGTSPSGDDLGAAFGRSGRWGRLVKRAGAEGYL